MDSARKSYKSKVQSSAGANMGLFSGLVMRPNRVPEMQAVVQNNPHAVPIYKFMPGDAAVNRGIGLLTVVGVACLLYGIGSMALGANKKKN